MAWRVHFDPFSQGLFLGRVLSDDATDFVTSINFERSMPGRDVWPYPVISGRDAISFLQDVMDAAYDAGLRPSRAQDERHIKAHLEDMRKLVFESSVTRTPREG